MTNVVFQKKRRFRIEPTNPYRTRYMIYQLVALGADKYRIEVEQYDYVLRSQVAEEKSVTPDMENPIIARQLVEYMLEHVEDAGHVSSVYYNWRNGRVPLICETKNVLVKEAIRRRFARNLKKM